MIGGRVFLFSPARIFVPRGNYSPIIRRLFTLIKNTTGITHYYWLCTYGAPVDYFRALSRVAVSTFFLPPPTTRYD